MISNLSNIFLVRSSVSSILKYVAGWIMLRTGLYAERGVSMIDVSVWIFSLGSLENCVWSCKNHQICTEIIADSFLWRLIMYQMMFDEVAAFSAPGQRRVRASNSGKSKVVFSNKTWSLIRLKNCSQPWSLFMFIFILLALLMNIWASLRDLVFLNHKKMCHEDCDLIHGNLDNVTEWWYPGRDAETDLTTVHCTLTVPVYHPQHMNNPAAGM